MDDAALRKLLSFQHADPHSILGAHPTGTDTLIRVYRPNAERVDVIVDGQRISLWPRIDFPDVFEGRLPMQSPPAYSLEVQYRGGSVFRMKDPYAFTPTLGPYDLYFMGEGKHHRLWERLGAHPMHHQGVAGISFVVWAPNASSVSAVGDFNSWDGRLHQMRSMGSSGLWELFIPELTEGVRYKFELRLPNGSTPVLKSDPMAFRTEVPPKTASIVHDLRHYHWQDAAWIERRCHKNWEQSPLCIYEIHLSSWMRIPEEGNRSLTYRELAPRLVTHVKQLGFTHVEFLPVSEHPYSGSWGYQVSGYFAPSARFGNPDDFRFLVDTLHANEIAVTIDWVPGHFPRDAWALARFDGTALYEHADPRLGSHPEWGTLIFNFGRNEVRNFLMANALFWIDQYHIDALRVDAVASMLYLDYSRKPGEWIPNRRGGHENEEAIAFLRELNNTIREQHPGVHVIAEESTAWPRVSHPTSQGGLGFTHKWNMGWMHDTLKYFGKDPIYREYHHHQLTFGTTYAWSEHFILPLSHDEVVHGKRSLASKMPGDSWQKLANLRALYGWMWAHPGKKLLFMGGEFAQWREWDNEVSLDWHLTQLKSHRRLMDLLAALNHFYKTESALHELDCCPDGFQWLQADNVNENTYAFVRRAQHPGRDIVCVANLSPVVRTDWRIGVPTDGLWEELLNTDATQWDGSGVHSGLPRQAALEPWDGQPHSLRLTLPPLAVLWLAPMLQ